LCSSQFWILFSTSRPQCLIFILHLVQFPLTRCSPHAAIIIFRWAALDFVFPAALLSQSVPTACLRLLWCHAQIFLSQFYLHSKSTKRAARSHAPGIFFSCPACRVSAQVHFPSARCQIGFLATPARVRFRRRPDLPLVHLLTQDTAPRFAPVPAVRALAARRLNRVRLPSVVFRSQLRLCVD
jgi:hypothetical protein